MTSSDRIDRPQLSSHMMVVRAMFVRLRFLMAIAMLSLLMAVWPWIRGAWEQWVWGSFAASRSESVSTDSEFFCPMDPGVHSAWPAICPICNMDLITRKKTDAVILPEGVLARMQLTPYRVQLAGVRTELVRTASEDSKTLLIPVSAVVHRDHGSIVYVETMPGMYDALPVTVGAKQNDQYELQAGLEAGQRVVSAGAFLIDAETRLNPSLAIQYFGANQNQARSTAPALAQRHVIQTPSSLSQADQALIAKQRICPVTKAPLGSMGQPVFMIVDGQKIALCCQGCEAAVLKDKAKYLAVLESNKAVETPSP